MAYYIFDEKKLVRNIFHRSGGSFLSAILTSRLSSPRCIEQQSVTSPSCKMINSRIRPSAQCLPKVASFCQDQRRIYVGFAIIKINNVRIIDVIGPARSLSRGHGCAVQDRRRGVIWPRKALRGARREKSGQEMAMQEVRANQASSRFCWPWGASRDVTTANLILKLSTCITFFSKVFGQTYMICI
jgi:hypothetical protein